MDNQGHKKDIHQTHDMALSHGNIEQDKNPIDYFSQDQSFVFLYKKTEKLATALYMVTNLFGDSEPMKWTLRTKVSHLLSFIIGFKDVLESREHEFSNEVKTRVLEIVSLLEVASCSGIVSPMNFSILKTEFMNLVQTLSTFKKNADQGTQFALPKTFFEVTKPLYQQSIAPRQEMNMGEYKRQYSHIKDTAVLDKKEEDQVVFKKTNRQSIIVNLLKRKKELTIKDIAEVIRDCSEKTIQRELIALIHAGVLKKVGERRWSKYSLIDTEIDVR